MANRAVGMSLLPLYSLLLSLFSVRKFQSDREAILLFWDIL